MPLGARIAIAVVLGLVLLFALLILWAKKSQARQTAAWSELGLRITSTKPMLRAEGSYRGFPVIVEETLHHHREGTSHATRIVLSGRGAAQAMLMARRQRGIASAEPAGMREIPTGDAAFDSHFRAFGQGMVPWQDPAHRARALALGTRGLLGEIVEVHVAQGQARVVLSHAGLAAAKIRDAVELAAALVTPAQWR